MKNFRFLAVLCGVLIISSVILSTEASAITVNESFMFVIGDKVPSDTDGYIQSRPISVNDADSLLTNGADGENLYSLLYAGSALDLFGYIDKYGIKEEKAYDITQKALSILTGDLSHTEAIKGLSSNERKYLAAVLKAGFDKKNIPSAVTLKGGSPVLKQDVYGDYVSEIMTIESVMGGIINITDLPSGVKVYTLSGEEAPYLYSGQSFYLKSSQPFTLGIQSIQHLYHIPEIVVSYHENGDFSPLVTAIMSAEKIASETTSVSFIQNPDTGDKYYTVKVVALTSFILILSFAVNAHRRRNYLKISR